MSLSPQNVTATGPPMGTPLSAIPALQIRPLDSTWGAIFLGMCISILLYGYNLHQIYRYFRLFPGDPRALMFLVVAILVAETIHTITPIHLCYYHLIQNYFNPVSLLGDTWSLRLLTPLGVVAICICQSFYVHRVYQIGPQYRVLVSLAVLLLLVEFGFMVVMTFKAFTGHQIQNFDNITWMVSVIFGSGVGIDLIVTGTLITALLKSRTGFRRTDSLIQTLIVYTINSGLATSIAGVLSFIFALLQRNNMIYIALGMITAKLYASSVLAVLNARQFLAERDMNGFTTDSLRFGGNLLPASTGGRFTEQMSRRPARVPLNRGARSRTWVASLARLEKREEQAGGSYGVKARQLADLLARRCVYRRCDDYQPSTISQQTYGRTG